MLLKLDNFRVNALRLACTADSADANLHDALAEYFAVSRRQVLDYRVCAKSVDARRGAPELVYTIFASLDDAARPRPGVGEAVTREEYLQVGAPVPPEFPARIHGLQMTDSSRR